MQFVNAASGYAFDMPTHSPGRYIPRNHNTQVSRMGHDEIHRRFNHLKSVFNNYQHHPDGKNHPYRSHHAHGGHHHHAQRHHHKVSW